MDTIMNLPPGGYGIFLIAFVVILALVGLLIFLRRRGSDED